MNVLSWNSRNLHESIDSFHLIINIDQVIHHVIIVIHLSYYLIILFYMSNLLLYLSIYQFPNYQLIKLILLILLQYFLIPILSDSKSTSIIFIMKHSIPIIPNTTYQIHPDHSLILHSTIITLQNHISIILFFSSIIESIISINQYILI